jgi:hypothetical protein
MREQPCRKPCALPSASRRGQSLAELPLDRVQLNVGRGATQTSRTAARCLLMEAHKKRPRGVQFHELRRDRAARREANTIRGGEADRSRVCAVHFVRLRGAASARHLAQLQMSLPTATVRRAAPAQRFRVVRSRSFEGAAAHLSGFPRSLSIQGQAENGHGCWSRRRQRRN